MQRARARVSVCATRVAAGLPHGRDASPTSDTGTDATTAAASAAATRLPQADVLGVLMYDCPEAVMENRLLERGKTSGRSDDKADVIRKRFHTYVESTLPIINHYAAQGKVSERRWSNEAMGR